jgi:hypothetical protein
VTVANLLVTQIYHLGAWDFTLSLVTDFGNPRKIVVGNWYRKSLSFNLLFMLKRPSRRELSLLKSMLILQFFLDLDHPVA